MFRRNPFPMSARHDLSQRSKLNSSSIAAKWAIQTTSIAVPMAANLADPGSQRKSRHISWECTRLLVMVPLPEA